MVPHSTQRQGHWGCCSPGTQAKAQWEEGTRATPPKPSFLAALSRVSCPGDSKEPGSQGAGACSAGPALGRRERHLHIATEQPLVPMLPKDPRMIINLPSEWPLTYKSFWGGAWTDRQAVPCLFLGRAEPPSSLLHGWAHSTHTHTRTALGEPRMPRPGRHNRGPRALWIPAVPGDRVSAIAARRWQCGDTRVCPDTGGSGWSGTCGDRVGGWSVWGAGTELPAPGALLHPSRLLVVLFHHAA